MRSHVRGELYSKVQCIMINGYMEPLPKQTDRKTLLKTLPCCNFVGRREPKTGFSNLQVSTLAHHKVVDECNLIRWGRVSVLLDVNSSSC